MQRLKRIVMAALLLGGIQVVWSVEQEAEEPGGDGRRPFLAERGWQGGDKRMGTPVREWLQRLKVEDPEEFERLMELRRSAPAQFRREIHQQLDKRFGKAGTEAASPGDKEIGRLASAYRQAEGEQKEALRQQLEARLRKTFDENLQQRRQALERMSLQLEQLRTMLEQRQKQRDSLIQKRLDALTRDPNPEQ